MSPTIKQFTKNIAKLTRSIRFRLTLWFVLILGMVLVAFSAFIFIRQAQDLKSAAIGRMLFKQRRINELIRFSNWENTQAAPNHPPDSLGSGTPFLQEGDFLALISLDGETIQSWGGIDSDEVAQIVEPTLASDVDAATSELIFFANVPKKGSPTTKYALILSPIPMRLQPEGYILIGSPVDPDNQLSRLLASLTVGVIATLVLAMAGGMWLADRAMRPVKTITHTARSIGETDLNKRLHLGREDELGELADTFDEMLDRIQAAFERQRQFTADASHELRTPLTIVDLEASRVLSTQRSAKEYEQSLNVIKSENQFMIRLVNNLLTLARMDAGQVVLNKQEVDLSDLGLEVVERLSPLAKMEGVKLISGDLPEVMVEGDRQFLLQMLMNLTENAIKHSKGERKRVELQVGSREEHDKLQAWIRIIDNGPGIAPEHLPHLFDRFYQVDKARTQQNDVEETEYEQAPSGAGLGLSIAQWIAHAHGGEIRVESEVGKGSIFEVSLPLISPLKAS